MNKIITQKAGKIFERVAKRYGIKDVSVNIHESNFRYGAKALYIDGDIVDLYWNNDGLGYSFQDELKKALKDAGIFAEPWTSTIFDVYKV